ncbi:MAG: 1-(5-phosphoribosyl)-5-((5-phosphoribosylamino)methylideneamino)imidazole-4-carboxamide isomerase [Deltaproteobacteria bacterium]|nr:MAG: 1-(5-phosphoribosyl)-5-((5-phosphoribosylamino)methylideneamino)imidazole-4-carboxamide isomerase [Deltaproteobacteria bacterium]
MKLFPAIDLLAGRAVRLEEGRRDRATVFHDRPVELVGELASGGADRLHVVDLDGAFGEPRQLALISEIVRASPIPVEVGGGLRDRAAIDRLLALGAAFAVLGTAAIRDPALVEDVCRAHPGCIIVAVDARDGIVAIDGWTASGGITARELAARAAGWGAAAVLYTASGGVGSLDDLAALARAGVPAVVVGRVRYDGRFTVADAARVAHTTPPA